MDKIGVGIIRAGFVADFHAQAYKQVSDAEVPAVASLTETRVKAFAKRNGVPMWFTDYPAAAEA